MNTKVDFLDKIEKIGIENMEEIEVLQLFLSYISPRADVQTLAERLLKKYESISNIIDSNVSDLKTVEGLNENNAKKIILFGELFYHYHASKTSKKFSISNFDELIEIIEDNLRFRNTENMILIALNSKKTILAKKKFNMNSTNEVGMSMLDFSGFLASVRPTFLVIAHSHPYGKAIPSISDDKSFEFLKDFCKKCGVQLIDSYIVGEDGVYSQDKEKLIRKYCDVEKLTDIFENIKNKKEDE